MSKELPDHGGSSWAYLFHDAAHRKRLALPRLWPRERADDFDVPVQAVAERGGNVLKKAWAIADGEKLASFDYRVPIFWYRSTAESELNDKANKGAFSIVPVEIRILGEKKRRKKP